MLDSISISVSPQGGLVCCGALTEANMILSDLSRFYSAEYVLLKGKALYESVPFKLLLKEK